MFGNKPMIAWSIIAAQNSGCFDQIIVSTDDTEIAKVSLAFGAHVPFMRPTKLADDFAGTTSVVSHAVQWFQDCGHELTAVCCLYATAPFVEPADIIKGLELLSQCVLDRFVFTVTAYSSPIQRALRLDPTTAEVNMWLPDQVSKRSQDLETAFHDAGQFYWGRPQAWLQSQNMFEGSKALLLPRWRVQDIDTEEDWTQAELMRKALEYQSCTT